MTDDPHKPLIWYYYQALDELVNSIENLVRETETYRWADLESICIQYLSDIKSHDSSSYILAEPNFEKQLADIKPSASKTCYFISEYPSDKVVELSKFENSLKPVYYFVYGYSNHHWFYQKIPTSLSRNYADHLILSQLL